MFLSIVIPAYKNAQYLPACLQSVIGQSFTDWEALVVVDGSPDDCARIAKEFSEEDNRIRVIDKEANEGLHLARKSGVKSSKGDYLLFLDADDELHEDSLKGLFETLSHHPVDMLHYGISVVDAGVGEQERAAFESFVNEPMPVLTNDELLEAVFLQSGGYRQDWRTAQRVYSRGLAEKAFELMTDDRLDRAEDSYEFFVLSRLAKEQLTDNSLVILDYYYGRGVTGSSALSRDSFAVAARDFQVCIDAIERFADGSCDAVREAAAGAKVKLLQLLTNDWLNRVSSSDKMAAARDLVDVIGGAEASFELMRLARDEAYRLWDKGECLEENAQVLEWIELSRELAGESCLPGSYRSLEASAMSHINNLKKRSCVNEYGKRTVRIFVSSHKDVDLFDSFILQPVQVGASSAATRFLHMLHDDEGDNISPLNPQYCELTTQYWAWKNIDADYYGFCHYRRYFNFSDAEYEENKFGEIIDDFIGPESQKRYCLDDDSICRTLEGFDVVTTRTQDIRRYMKPDATIRSQYDAAEKLYIKDLDCVVDILVRRHPDYRQDAECFLSGHTGRFCNMFIMKREIFQEYCEWLFPILEEFTQVTDMMLYSKEALRTPGHLAERLLNIFLLHHERVGTGWRMKELQCVHFNQPDFHYRPEMQRFENDERPVVPVVFAADNNYVPMLTTALYSMMQNSSSEYNYEATILQRDISYENRALMIGFFTERFSNVSLQFCDVTPLVNQYRLTTNNAHISAETYYRFLIQELMPHYNKVLYLDSDLIIRGDVSELYGVQLDDNLLAAVPDIDFVGNVNMQDGERKRYAREILGMEDPYAYFQAGVLVLNTRAMRELHSLERWFEFASDERFIYNDQDVLNAHCEGRVAFLPYEWNVMIDCANRVTGVFPHAPAAVFDAFNRSRANEKIVHYAGFEKPWSMVDCDRAELYWSYARETPFYEHLLAMLYAHEEPVVRGNPIDDHECVVSSGNPLRKVVDPIAPLGTARREVLKSIGRLVRGRR